MKKIIYKASAFIALLTLSFFLMSPVHAKTNIVFKTQTAKNQILILAKIKTGNNIEIKNCTDAPLKLNKKGYLYEPLKSNKPTIIENDVEIAADDIVFQNASIEGNLYISANNAALKNLKISGTIILNSQVKGICNLDKVTSKNIKVLSSAVKITGPDTDNRTVGIPASEPEKDKQDVNDSGSDMKTETDEISNSDDKAESGTDVNIITGSAVNAVTGSAINTITGPAVNVITGSAVKPKAPAKLVAYLEMITVSDYNDKLIVVNKTRSLPDYYKPMDLTQLKVDYMGRSEARYMRKEAADALSNLFAKAGKSNINLCAVSGFRSYELQKTVYNKYVALLGSEAASMVSAASGKSEHQTGLSVDISLKSMKYQLDENFGKTREGIWLKQYAAEFGFILRYPKGKEAVTGYAYEPWHIRYIGRDIAMDIMKKGTTLEEYFGLASP